MTRYLLFKQLLETLQVVNVDVGYRPVGEIAVAPMDQVIALPLNHCLCCAVLRRCWPNKEINKMFAFLVNQSCYRAAIEVIKATANQRKTLAGKVWHGSREIELCIQPWLYRVMIGRWDVREVVCHERANVTSYKLCREKLIGIGRAHSRQENCGDKCA